MYGVIRFLDTDLLPASLPEDYPKIIKSGIDEEGQNIKSPKITGPSGVVTLLHRLGRPQLLEKLLDDAGTHDFYLRTRKGLPAFSDFYVKRQGYNVEIGFIDDLGEFAQHGVRYRIEHDPENPQTVGKWTPLSTSDLGSAWGGVDHWVRAQGAAITKGIWWNSHWDAPKLDISWSDMTDAEKEDLDAWMKERTERLEAQSAAADTEYKERREREGAKHTEIEMQEMMHKYNKMRLSCRADCGEEHPKLRCSQCKVARYCSPECQKEDWKYHKTYCGTETPVSEEYAT